MTTTTDDRAEARRHFLAAAGWGDAVIVPLTGDASTRRYFRLGRAGQQALLMDAPPGAESAACPPDADSVARTALGYNALARLAGPRLDAFTTVARTLTGAGVRAPLVHADDPHEGFALIEDFGDRHLKDVADDPETEEALYTQALDVLAQVRTIDPGALPPSVWPILTYDALALRAEADLLPQWYVPFTGGILPDAAAADWEALWEGLAARLSAPSTLVLRDFHAENILVTPAGLGVIDFQDALIGQPAYDAVSLIEDARRDVSPFLADRLYAMDRDRATETRAYETDYAILAAQRNAKILGVFARLVVRDKKPRYESFMPRVRAHFAKDLKRPQVEPLRDWVGRHLPPLLEAE